jgi:hypothetical protein
MVFEARRRLVMPLCDLSFAGAPNIENFPTMRRSERCALREAGLGSHDSVGNSRPMAVNSRELEMGNRRTHAARFPGRFTFRLFSLSFA